MPRPVLGLRPHVEHDHVAPRQPLLKLRGGNLLDPVPLTQVLVRQLIHLCDVAHRDIAHRRPEIAHPLARQPIEDPRPLPARANQTRPSQNLQVLRRVRDALGDLVRDLLDRALALREHIHDLRPAAAAERLRHRRERVEQGHLRGPIAHKNSN